MTDNYCDHITAYIWTTNFTVCIQFDYYVCGAVKRGSKKTASNTKIADTKEHGSIQQPKQGDSPEEWNESTESYGGHR